MAAPTAVHSITAEDGTKLVDATNKTLVGTLTGNVTGNVTGDMTAPTPVVVSAASGAIAIPTGRVGLVAITYNGGAGAYTLADPAAGDDGKVLKIWTETAQAHVLTDATSGFNLKGSSGTCTWTAAIGNAVELVARNQKWIALVKTGVTIA